MAETVRASLNFLGGAGGVTGSKFLFTYGNDQVLLDCGLFQGLKALRLRNWAPVPLDFSRLRGVVLTHAHIDHSGYLPRIVGKGYKGPVFATPATCDLLRVMLLDARTSRRKRPVTPIAKGIQSTARLYRFTTLKTPNSRCGFCER